MDLGLFDRLPDGFWVIEGSVGLAAVLFFPVKVVFMQFVFVLRHFGQKQYLKCELIFSVYFRYYWK